jgi:hypothetical protein
MFQQAIKNSNVDKLKEISKQKINIFSSLALLEIAIIEKNIDKLNKYSYKDKALIKEYALLQEVFLLIKKNNFTKAKSRLDSIPIDSSINKLANNLKHYLITK